MNNFLPQSRPISFSISGIPPESGERKLNQLAPFNEQISKFSPLDVLLADVAIRVQLTPTEYMTANQHYKVMGDWIDRPESPLHGLVDEFYPQGGFSTGSTIAGHSDDAEFDLDAMARINWPRNIDPETALSWLHKAIAGDFGSRYYDKAERKTRCSQVKYESMHLDVTPSVLLGEYAEKTSFIFHSKPSDSSVKKETLFANPYGLAQWFNARVLQNIAFGTYFERQSLQYDRTIHALKADTTPVPEQLPAYKKSPQVVCLQLIKRWRNVAYDRNHKARRLPPSVLLTYFIGDQTGGLRTLTDELIYHVEFIADRIELASANTRTLSEVNPTCHLDVLTDRWPENIAEQDIFVRELRGFSADLRRLKAGVPVAEMRRVLERLFGEKPAGDAIDALTQRHVQDSLETKSLFLPGIGALPALGSYAAPAIARPIPKSTPFGD